MNNPYAAPSADLSSVDDGQTYTPSLFSRKGRLGRLRYMLYSQVLGWSAAVLALVLLSLLEQLGSGAEKLWVLAYIPPLLVAVNLGGRRLNDMNLSAWWLLLIMVPLINLVGILALLVAPGSAGSNRFGPAPAPGRF